MRRVDDSKKTYEETAGEKLTPIEFIVPENNIVVLQPTKNPDRHSSYDKGIDNNPVLYYNIPHVVNNPDRKYTSESKNLTALENSKTGSTMLYEKDNIFEYLNTPDRIALPNQTYVIAVKFCDDGTNYVQTRFTVPRFKDLDR